MLFPRLRKPNRKARSVLRTTHKAEIPMTPTMVDINTMILSLVAVIGIVSPFVLAHLTTKAAKEACERAIASLEETKKLREDIKAFLVDHVGVPVVPVEIVSMPDNPKTPLA